MWDFEKVVLTVGLVLSMTLDAPGAASSPVPFSVMSYNVENGGAQVDFNKTVEAIRKSGADVVGIQEAWGNTERLAREVGWQYFDPRQHIISRYPLREAPDSNGVYTLIEVQPGRFVAMANMHLPDEPYGPDLIRVGEEIAISWTNAPGNRYDYVRITPVGSKRLAWGEAIRLYTRGELDGSVKYNEANVRGNWLDWYKSDDGQWPLPAGQYDVKLMLDDGFTELAATTVKIQP